MTSFSNTFRFKISLLWGHSKALEEIYAKYVHFVTISTDIDVASSPVYQQLKEKCETERAAKEYLMREISEFEIIKEEIKESKESLEKF